MRKYISIFFCLFVLAEAVKEGPDVVGGIDAKLEQRPFQVSLQLYGRHFCGGSIISPHFVLTAAHCHDAFFPHETNYVSANAGMIDVRKPRQRNFIIKFIDYEKYRDYNVELHDIAVVALKTPFTFDSYVQPIKLPRRDLSVPANSAVILSGWGGLGGKENRAPTILQIVALQTVDQELCKSLIESNGTSHLYNTNLCAYIPLGGKGSCQGDSGGPLTFGGVQVGIVSWSEKDPYCASTGKPGVYTRVTKYVNWIRKKVVGKKASKKISKTS